MDKYICSCCGGRIDRATMTCEYCGTQYEEKHDQVIRIETFRNPVVTLQRNFAIDEDMLYKLGPEKASELVMHEMVNKLSECLIPFIEVQTEFDPCKRVQTIHSRIKVVQPVNNGGY